MLLQIDQESLAGITSILGVVTSVIGESGTVAGSACSPLGSDGDACTAQTMCCQDDHFVRIFLFSPLLPITDVVCHQNGLLVLGCTNLDFPDIL